MCKLNSHGRYIQGLLLLLYPGSYYIVSGRKIPGKKKLLCIRQEGKSWSALQNRAVRSSKTSHHSMQKIGLRRLNKCRLLASFEAFSLAVRVRV